jgi:hypothetical protein
MNGNAAGILQDYGCSYHYYFLIDAQGVIRWRGLWDEAAVRALAADLVAQAEVAAVDALPSPAVRLLPAYPNPFNPLVRIPWELDGEGEARVSLQVFDARGRLVNTLASGTAERGRRQETMWQGRDARGQAMPSGTYTVTLKADGVVRTRTVTLLR